MLLDDGVEAELRSVLAEGTRSPSDRSPARCLRRARLPGWRAAGGSLVVGCLALASFAALRSRGSAGPATAAAGASVGLDADSSQQWQCDGGPGFGTMELVSREMDPNSNTAYVRCCKCFGLGKLGSTPRPCDGPVNWYEARSICMQHGMRLCTKQELEDGEAADTGCGYDDQYVWATDKPYGFKSQGAGSVCRRDQSDDTMDGRGTAIVLAIGPQEECEAKCLHELSCTGYEYRSSESRCEIWTQPITFHTTAVHKDEFDCKVKTCPT